MRETVPASVRPGADLVSAEPFLRQFQQYHTNAERYSAGRMRVIKFLQNPFHGRVCGFRGISEKVIFRGLAVERQTDC